jgi:hypothetical protein
LTKVVGETETRRTRSIDDLPGPNGWPIVGSFFDIDLSQIHAVFENWAAEYGRAFLVRIGQRPMVVFSDAEISQSVLRARPDTYRRISTVQSIFDEMGVSGVFSAE